MFQRERKPYVNETFRNCKIFLSEELKSSYKEDKNDDKVQEEIEQAYFENELGKREEIDHQIFKANQQKQQINIIQVLEISRSNFIFSLFDLKLLVLNIFKEIKNVKYKEFELFDRNEVLTVAIQVYNYF